MIDEQDRNRNQVSRSSMVCAVVEGLLVDVALLGGGCGLGGADGVRLLLGGGGVVRRRTDSHLDVVAPADVRAGQRLSWLWRTRKDGRKSSGACSDWSHDEEALEGPTR